MMGAAQRHGELVADLAAQSLHLRKFQVVRIRRLAAAQQATIVWMAATLDGAGKSRLRAI